MIVPLLPHSDGVAAVAWQQPWRWMFASETVCVLMFVIFVFRLPRSPRWLAQKGRYDEALEVLTRIDGPEYARREIEEIKPRSRKRRADGPSCSLPGCVTRC